MNEKELESIREEAKEILESFSKALGKAKVGKKDLKTRVGGFREEGSGEEGDKDFRRRMFENAPEVEGDFLIAEKKKW